MSEVKKRKIVIASVLKPVHDTRMSEKIAQTLAETRQYEVHVIGFPVSDADTVIADAAFITHSLPHFKRLSIKRILMPLKILRKVLRLNPDLLIITTHELLTISVMTKLLRGCKIIYDVQENYYRNIISTQTFTVFFRPFLAAYVRLKEVLLSSFVNHFFLAEKGYENEISFPGKNFTVLENKVRFPRHQSVMQRNPYQLLFSGTLAETTGVFNAIALAVKLHAVEPKISLTIIGHCAQDHVLKKIKDAIASHQFIQLIGGRKLVAHDLIISKIHSSGAGIICYPPNPSTHGSIPTKLYEYLGFHLPILLYRHPLWVNLCSSFKAAVVLDPSNIDPPAILKALKDREFYFVKPKNVYWEGEEPKLIRQVQLLLN